jgi:hypothetical protein
VDKEFVPACTEVWTASCLAPGAIGRAPSMVAIDVHPTVAKNTTAQSATAPFFLISPTPGGG